MKAAVLEEIRMIVVKEIKKPVVSGKNVLIEVKATGICGTDVHEYHGDWPLDLPVVPGHEFAGVVEEIGPEVKYVKVGERVTVSPDIYCNSCKFCRTGNETLCENVECLGMEWNGSFAEYCLVPEKQVYAIPNNVSFEAASMIEPMACVYTVIRNIEEIYNKRILITGAGSTGLLFTMLLKNAAAFKIDITSRSQEKLDVAKKIGADEVINTKDAAGSYSELTDNKYDIIIDVTGVSAVVENSLDLIDTNGSLYIFGVAKENSILKIDHSSIFYKNLKIFGAYPDLRSFGSIIKKLEKKQIDPTILISHRFSLNDFLEGFKLIEKQTGSSMKIIINP